MANTVIALKKSATPSSVPADLANGELAINYADGKLYYKAANGTIASISGNEPNYFGTVNADGTLIVSDIPGDVLTIVAGENINIIGDTVNDKITISATFSGGDPQYAFNQANVAYSQANAAYDAANNAVTDFSPAHITANAAYDKANSANLLAYNTGIGANAFTSATITGANAAVGTGANAYANLVWSRSNTYTDTIASSINAFTSATIAGANTAVGLGANTYADQTFVKLTAPTQTITGNVDIVGNLTLSGNTFVIEATRLEVDDPLLYLAANNYSSDIVDIGFIANYVNTTGANVHTGLYREHENKEYYLFQGYDKEPINNHIGAMSNNMTLAVLNADIKTSNLVLGGVNAIVTISASFENSNAAYVTANSGLVQANTARDAANAAFDKANTGGGSAYYSGNNGDVGNATGLGDIFRVHTNTLTANVTIYSGNNALAAGPITVASGRTLTIQTNARIAIV